MACEFGMSAVDQILMYAAAIFIFFFIGCLFTKREYNYVFTQTFAKGSAVVCIALFAFNYHINIPIKEVYWILLVLALLGLVAFVYKVAKCKTFSWYQLLIFTLLIVGGYSIMPNSIFFRTIAMA